MLESRRLLSASISGTKFLDTTGNGFSLDDAPLGGVTVKLFKDADASGTLSAGDGAAVQTAVTSTSANPAQTGTYAFTGLTPGRYFVQEVVPSGYVRTGPALGTYRTVDVTSADQVVTGQNFDDFKIPDTSHLTGVSYVDQSEGGTTTTFATLAGHTQPCDQLTANFTITGTQPVQVTLVAYVSPFSSLSLPSQTIFAIDTGIFAPGQHSLKLTLPCCFYQVDLVVGPAIDHFGPNGSNIRYAQQDRLIDTDHGGMSASADVSGYVFQDLNGDCIRETGEPGIAGVTVTLTGHQIDGSAVSLVTHTDATGKYAFSDVPVSDAKGYTITETEPAGYVHEGQMAGSTGGTTGDHTITTVLGPCVESTENDFCETLPTHPLAKGDTATIGFWHNKNGQALIDSLNGGPTATKLGNWLATTFPNLYGGLAGKTNAQVAAYYLTLFGQTGMKTGAQVLGAALAAYVTNSTLAGGTMAAGYGFNVSPTAGTGFATYNVGTTLAPFGGPTGTVTVLKLLLFVNSKSSGGVLANGNTALLNAINDIFDAINQGGDIG